MLFGSDQRLTLQSVGIFKVTVKTNRNLYNSHYSVCPYKQPQETGGFLFPVYQEQDLRIMKVVTLYRTKYERKPNIPRQRLELPSGIRQGRHTYPDVRLRGEHTPESVDADFINDLKYFKNERI